MLEILDFRDELNDIARIEDEERLAKLKAEQNKADVKGRGR